MIVEMPDYVHWSWCLEFGQPQRQWTAHVSSLLPLAEDEDLPPERPPIGFRLRPEPCSVEAEDDPPSPDWMLL